MIYFQGTVLANKVGRRWTHSTLLGINALLFGAVMVMVPYQVCYKYNFFLLEISTNFSLLLISTLTLASPSSSKCSA